MGCGAAAALLFLAACQGDWDEPTNNPFGNSSINDENIITIQQLITQYPNVFASTDENKKIDTDLKIKGSVTGNDIGGNLYKQFTIQDETAAIIIAVNQSGMNGFLPEGQEIVVALQDLYIGGYRKQPEIGQPYNGTSIGRMNKDLFQQHYKYVGTPDPSAVKPLELTADEFANIVIAYEPVWAIGTGKTATPEQAQEMHHHIRSLIEKKYGHDTADNTTILYGGSCNAKNAKELFANPDVDGGLIGGASLKADDFVTIIESL